MPEITGIMMRIRRVSEQVAYVRLPVTEGILAAIHTGDHNYISAAACSIGEDADTKWVKESPDVIEVHPIQTPVPDGYM